MKTLIQNLAPLSFGLVSTLAPINEASASELLTNKNKIIDIPEKTALSVDKNLARNNDNVLSLHSVKENKSENKHVLLTAKDIIKNVIQPITNQSGGLRNISPTRQIKSMFDDIFQTNNFAAYKNSVKVGNISFKKNGSLSKFRVYEFVSNNYDSLNVKYVMVETNATNRLKCPNPKHPVISIEVDYNSGMKANKVIYRDCSNFKTEFFTTKDPIWSEEYLKNLRNKNTKALKENFIDVQTKAVNSLNSYAIKPPTQTKALDKVKENKKSEREPYPGIAYCAAGNFKNETTAKKMLKEVMDPKNYNDGIKEEGGTVKFLSKGPLEVGGLKFRVLLQRNTFDKEDLDFYTLMLLNDFDKGKKCPVDRAYVSVKNARANANLKSINISDFNGKENSGSMLRFKKGKKVPLEQRINSMKFYNNPN
jgi:hypothetical protein